jgi:hypothetical protein
MLNARRKPGNFTLNAEDSLRSKSLLRLFLSLMAGQRLTQKKNFLSFPFPPSIKRFKSSLPGEASDRPRVSTIDPAFLPSQFSHL